MKKSILAMAASLAVFGAHATNPQAIPPTLNITSPTGTVYVASFPASVSVTTSIVMNDGTLGALTQFRLNVNDTLYLDVNPYQQDDTCFAPTQYPAGVSCSASSGTSGSITGPVTIPGPGTYSITATTKLKNVLGEDMEQVQFQILAVEYPAPPAVANAYINTSNYNLSGKQRGCIISQIANNHAQGSKYGPKGGGPYNDTMIKADVGTYSSLCPR